MEEQACEAEMGCVGAEVYGKGMGDERETTECRRDGVHAERMDVGSVWGVMENGRVCEWRQAEVCRVGRKGRWSGEGNG